MILILLYLSPNQEKQITHQIDLEKMKAFKGRTLNGGVESVGNLSTKGVSPI